MQSVTWLFAFTLTFPHGDLDDRINAITQQINITPDQIELYQQRGELYVAHEEYTNAISDFRQCLQHKLSNARVCQGLSESFLHTNKADSALVYIEQVLRDEPTNPNAIELHAGALEQLDLLCEAAAVRGSLLTISPNVTPSLYLNAASAWLMCPDPAGADHAIEILQQGLLRTGYIRLLQQKLVSMYAQQENWAQAIRAQDEIIQHSSMKSRPLYERAALNIRAGKFATAKNDLITALELWEKLPLRKKEIASLQTLHVEIKSLLSTIDN